MKVDTTSRLHNQKTNGTATEQIGQEFINPAFVPQQTIVEDDNGNHIGVNQGYSFQFPNNTYIEYVLGGYSGSYQENENYQGNRFFILEEGNMIIFNEVVIQATGIYEIYKGTSITEQVISSDPYWISEITLNASATITTDDDDVDSDGDNSCFGDPDCPYDFRITSDGGWYDAMVRSRFGETNR